MISGNKEIAMMLSGLKEFVGMALIERPSSYSSNIILEKKINRCTLHTLFLIHTLSCKIL